MKWLLHQLIAVEIIAVIASLTLCYLTHESNEKNETNDDRKWESLLQKIVSSPIFGCLFNSFQFSELGDLSSAIEQRLFSCAMTFVKLEFMFWGLY